jgi:hypothetical protein
MFKTITNKRKALSYLLGTISIVFFIYSFSLFRPWQPFDERLFYNEEFLPIPQSFDEVFKVINLFVLNSHIVSTNVFFSNHMLLRSDPLAWSILTFIFFLFKKNAFLYHLLQLFIHLTNSMLIFLISKKSVTILNKKTLGNFNYLFISIFTLIWALHSTCTEAVLLATNWMILLTYTFCFCFILYEITKIERNDFRISLTSTTIISILFCLLMFFTEYAYTLPFILLFIIFSFTLKSSPPINKAIVISLKKSLPYFIGLLFYILLSLINQDSAFNHLNTTSLYAFLERSFWLSPQIFMHFLKLFFFPKTLSTYQSNLIHLSDGLSSPYSIFCTSIYLIFLTLPVVSKRSGILEKTSFDRNADRVQSIQGMRFRRCTVPVDISQHVNRRNRPSSHRKKEVPGQIVDFLLPESSYYGNKCLCLSVHPIAIRKAFPVLVFHQG